MLSDSRPATEQELRATTRVRACCVCLFSAFVLLVLGDPQILLRGNVRSGLCVCVFSFLTTDSWLSFGSGERSPSDVTLFPLASDCVSPRARLHAKVTRLCGQTALGPFPPSAASLRWPGSTWKQKESNVEGDLAPSVRLLLPSCSPSPPSHPTFPLPPALCVYRVYFLLTASSLFGWKPGVNVIFPGHFVGHCCP